MMKLEQRLEQLLQNTMKLLINLEILSLWIQGKGKPLSWSVLINVLKSIELPILAKDIENGLAFL